MNYLLYRADRFGEFANVGKIATTATIAAFKKNVMTKMIDQPKVTAAKFLNILPKVLLFAALLTFAFGAERADAQTWAIDEILIVNTNDGKLYDENSNYLGYVYDGGNFHIEDDTLLYFYNSPLDVTEVGKITTDQANTGKVRVDLDGFVLNVASIGEASKPLALVESFGGGTVDVSGGVYVKSVNIASAYTDYIPALQCGNLTTESLTIGDVKNAGLPTQKNFYGIVDVIGSLKAGEIKIINGTLTVLGNSDIGTLLVGGGATLIASSANFDGRTKIDTLTVGAGHSVFFGAKTEINTLVAVPGDFIFDTGVSGSIARMTAPGGLHGSSRATISLDGGRLSIGSDEANAFSRFDGRIVEKTYSSTVEKVGLDTWRLTGSNDYWGGTIVSGGVLETDNLYALGMGGVSLGDGILRVGCATERKSSQLFINSGTWNSVNNDGQLELVVGVTGECSTISLSPASSVQGTTNVSLVGRTEDINQLGSRLIAFPTMRELIVAPVATSKDAFVLTGANVFQYNPTGGDSVQRFETSRYGFEFDGSFTAQDASGFDFRAWNMQATDQPVLVPDLSTMVLTNIIGFEIPRAQNVNGPWARMRGGELNDNKAMFDKNSYQTIQVGWDKSLDAKNDSGSWNVGIFFEGDWLYGRGNWSSMWETIQGKLNSSATGIGAGLYVSRVFKNGLYVDAIGRMNVFENKVNMNVYDVHHANGTTFLADPTNNYRGAWTSSIFNLAIEIGKDFKSKNKRVTFNPYNRFIYTSAPSQQFDVVFGDNSIVNINNHSVDAWTNKLGARLAYKTTHQCGRWNHIFYTGADYYQGLSGRFVTETLDTLVTGANWQTVRTNRPKNDLSYGTATFGMTILPKENIDFTVQNDILFGEVNGWSVGLSGKVSF